MSFFEIQFSKFFDRHSNVIFEGGFVIYGQDEEWINYNPPFQHKKSGIMTSTFLLCNVNT